jgi:hypothetical protein
MAEKGFNDLEAIINKLKKQKELCQELLKNAGLKIKVLESRCKLLEEKVEFEKKNQDILRDQQTIELLQKDSIITKLENERKKAEDKTYENEKEEKKSN